MNPSVVVDTNIISYFFLNTPYTENAEKLFQLSPQWCVPYLWKSEFRNVLALYLRKQLISVEDTFTLMEHAEQMMDGNEFFVTSRHVITLVDQSSCSAYDCEYVALAQLLNMKLITQDKKILSDFPETAADLNTFLKNR